MLKIDESRVERGVSYLLLTDKGWQIGQYTEDIYPAFIVQREILPLERIAEIFSLDDGLFDEVKVKTIQRDDSITILGLSEGSWYLLKGAFGWRVGRWVVMNGRYGFRDWNETVYGLEGVQKVYALDMPKPVRRPVARSTTKTIPVILNVPFMSYTPGMALDLPVAQAESLIAKNIAKRAAPESPVADVAVDQSEADAEVADGVNIKVIDAPASNKRIKSPRMKK